jgi:hypothetical protein
MLGRLDDPKRPTLGAQVRELIAWSRAHPLGGAFLVAVLVIALASALRPPAAPTPDRLVAGQCLSLRGATAPADVVAAVQHAAVDPAACGLAHSHEVAGVIPVSSPAPGAPTLDSSAMERDCSAAFASYVGHPVEGSVYVLVTVPPTMDAWAAGDAVAVCLVARADGTPMTSLAGGSGE